MITLQNFIAPEQEICTEHALYYQAHGPVGFSQSSSCYHLSEGAKISFGSYFNIFSLGKWNRGCALDNLFAELSGSGTVEIRVMHARPGRSWEVAYCEIVDLPEDQPHQIDLSAFAGEGIDGALYAEVMALEGSASLTGGRFCTDGQPAELPRLAVSITTFKREDEVRRTVERLEEFLEGFAFGAQIHVQVVDNGKSAEIEKSRHVTPYPNPNLGGSGGFARGLLEAEKGGFSHCLFMDDDAAFHMENIARAYVFLALARESDTAVSGAMINNTHKWSMWENGAVFDGSCHPLYIGTDLRDISAVTGMEFDSARTRPPGLYGGWWFFAFPIAHVTRHPFPFFVRGDDISFSLANDFSIYTLNGVVSFQDDFTEKESAQTLYLDLRNHLIHHLVFEDLERSPLGTAKIALRFMMRSILRFHYETAEAQLLAWQDVMQGPEFFAENIDMSARRADIKALTETEAWQPLNASPPARRQRFGRLPNRLRHYLFIATLNGHLLPLWGNLGDRLTLSIGERGKVHAAFGAAEITYLNTNQDKSYTVRQSKARFLSLGWRMAKTLLRFCRSYPQLQKQWREGYPQLASKGFWEKTLD